MTELQCIVVTPERTVCEEMVDFVAVPLFDGEIGIAPGHTPLIGRLGFGELRLHGDEGVRRYYVEEGFVEVLHNVVTLLTQRAVPAGELDAAVAAEQLQAVLTRPARAPEEIELRYRQAAQLRAQLRMVGRGSP
jgi:F-type H+-transporting ATPase subunit epsilon